MPKYMPFNTGVKLSTNEYIVSYYKIYLMIPNFIGNTFLTKFHSKII